VTLEVRVKKPVAAFLDALPAKSRRIVFAALKDLGENPFPGGGGDKELLTLQGGSSIYRLHIARTFTAFYDIDTTAGTVSVYELLTIEQAHKRYGRL
jgi:mRNA-degrading endonuclease RelE of RelBE toxin-antitoxin system